MPRHRIGYQEGSKSPAGGPPKAPLVCKHQEGAENAKPERISRRAGDVPAPEDACPKLEIEAESAVDVVTMRSSTKKRGWDKVNDG